jgi:RNA-binding protein
MVVRLTPRQRARLKARAHAVEPIVRIGQAGVSESVVAEVDRALTAHGLIKVKLAGADRDARNELTGILCTRTDAVAVQQVGRVLTLWRPRPDDEPLDEGDDEDRHTS